MITESANFLISLANQTWDLTLLRYDLAIICPFTSSCSTEFTGSPVDIKWFQTGTAHHSSSGYDLHYANSLF